MSKISGLTIYAFTQHMPGEVFEELADSWHDGLSDDGLFTPNKSTDLASIGFDSVYSVGAGDPMYVEVFNQRIFILKVTKEERKVSNTQVARELTEFTKEYLQEHGEHPPRRTRLMAKEDIMRRLLKTNSTSVFTSTTMMVDTARQLIIFDTSNAGRCEEALALTRTVLGSLPVTPYAHLEALNRFERSLRKSWAQISYDLGDAGHRIDMYLKFVDVTGAEVRLKHLEVDENTPPAVIDGIHSDGYMPAEVRVYDPEKQISYNLSTKGKISAVEPDDFHEESDLVDDLGDDPFSSAQNALYFKTLISTLVADSLAAFYTEPEEILGLED